MASTYNSASVTLVLDAGIRKCSIGRPFEEVILHILASTWMRRLWTLQEGALAGRLVFLLKDYFLELENRLRVEVKRSYQLVDVVQRKAFRLFDQRDIGSEDSDYNHSTICDAIAIREHPMGELIPRIATSLVREEELEEDNGVVGYEYGEKFTIISDEFVE